ncbi:ADP/ATP carrier protein [Entophlyctis sp. JEL0112]|nr:ADP/ATP carrier protein [Entophlyctis sp. JEL0112]
MAAVIANAVVYPLDMSAQTDSTKPHSPARAAPHRDYSAPYSSQTDALRRIVSEEGGVRALYAGIVASLTQTAVSSFAYFWAYAFVRRVYLRLMGKRGMQTRIGVIAELALGAAAGAISRLLTTPVSVVTTRRQTQNGTTNSGVVRDILRTYGVAGFWRGFPASLVLTVNPAITYGLYAWVQGRATLSPEQAFFVGAATKAAATIVTYPYIMAKVRMQWRAPQDLSLPGDSSRNITYSSAGDVLQKVLQTEGVRGLYAGLEAQLLKAVLCQGILFVSKDWFESVWRSTLKFPKH